jgi:fatty-acyl-CoA synthase
LGKLRLVTIGGSAAPRAHDRILPVRGVEVGHAWGMTEMSPIGTTGGGRTIGTSSPSSRKVDIIAKQGARPFGVEMRIVRRAGSPAHATAKARAGCRCADPG